MSETNTSINGNNWVMHPVARVSIKQWKTSVRNTEFFSARSSTKKIYLIKYKWR
jgi:hypothetical protein